MGHQIDRLSPPKGTEGLHQVRENIQRIVQTYGGDTPLLELSEELESEVIHEMRGSMWHCNYDQLADSRFYGGIVDHPTWVALYVDNRDNEIIMGLQRLLLAAVLHEEIRSTLKSHDISGFGLVIRKVGRNFRNKANYKGSELLDVLSKNDEANLTRFIKLIQAQEVVRRERGPVVGISRQCMERMCLKIDKHGILKTLIPEDPDDPVGFPEVAQYLPNKKNSLQGFEPGENFENDQILVLIENLKRLSVEIRIGKHRSEAARGILAGVVAAPVISRRQLSDGEIFKLFNLIDRLSEYPRGSLEWTSALIFKVMLTTSSSIEDAAGMGSDRDVPIKYSSKNDAYHIARIRPEYRTRRFGIKNIYTDNILNHRDYVEVPNVFIGKDDFKEYLRNCEKYGLLQLKNFLKSSLEVTLPRVTLSMISRITYEVARSAHDPVIVQTTFGISVPSASSQMYYTAVSEKQVLTCYLYAVNEVLKRAGRDLVDFPIINRGYYSPRDVITDHDLKKLIDSIRSDLRETPHGSERWHNLVTLQCIVIQAIFTTVRGVYDPLIEIAHDGPVYFRDKDNSNFSHARFQYCHPMARIISDYYRSIREHYIGDFVDDHKIDAFSYFRGSDWNLNEPKYGVIKEMLSQYCEFPLNSIRKYIRTKMVALNVGYDAINMVMNHHSAGESFWDSFSTVNPMLLRSEILSFYDGVIIDLGIKQEWFNVV